MPARSRAPAFHRSARAAALLASTLSAAACSSTPPPTHADLPDPVAPAPTRPPRPSAAAGTPDPEATGQEADRFAGLAENLSEMFRVRTAKAAADTTPFDETPAREVRPRAAPAPAVAPSTQVPAQRADPGLAPATVAPPAPAVPAAATPPPTTPPVIPIAPAAPPAAAPERATLALPKIALCTRVEGYGRFTPFASDHFVAGRPISVILYTEVEHFNSTPVGGTADEPDDWQVELGQTVTLYLESDGSRQAVFPEAIVKDTAKTRRRDFYLAQRLDLPRTLSVGTYNLKVAVRDVAGGAVAEEVVRLVIVADAGAAAGSTRVPMTLPTPREPKYRPSRPNGSLRPTLEP